MGFWSFLPGVADDPPSPQKQQERTVQLGQAKARVDNTPLPAPAPPRYDPASSSYAIQRYLSSVGWDGVRAQPIDTGNKWIDPKTLRDIGPHAYSLSDWQQGQVAEDYGVLAPDGRQALKGDIYRTARVNPSDYDNLTPQQQNAMRFNELLIAATEKDRQAKVAPEEQDSGYQSRVAEMFGTEGGSEVYAPNTMALLDKMGMGRLRGQDLDEYLSLDRAYDVNEIQALKPWEGTPEIGPYQGIGVSAGPEVQSALDMRQIDLAGGLIEKALADTSITGWNEQARIDQFLGRRPPVEQVPIGWLVGNETRADEAALDRETTFQKMYSHLSSKSTSNLDSLWGLAQQKGFTDADYNEIFDYFYLKSLEDDRLGPIDDTFRTGQQVRDFIGIG